MKGLKTPEKYKADVEKAVSVLKEANKEARIEYYMKKFNISRAGALLKIKEIDAEKRAKAKAQKSKPKK
jgi:hypothetical protein